MNDQMWGCPECGYQNIDSEVIVKHMIHQHNYLEKDAEIAVEAVK